jgi:hypothetical protein
LQAVVSSAANTAQNGKYLFEKNHIARYIYSRLRHAAERKPALPTHTKTIYLQKSSPPPGAVRHGLFRKSETIAEIGPETLRKNITARS